MGGAADNSNEQWPLLVCAFPSPPYGKSVQHNRYVHEIIGHAGVCHLAVELEELVGRLPNARLLVTVGECKLTDEQRRAIADFVARGGGWVSVGGVCGMEAVLGVEAVLPPYRSWGGATVSTMGEGYLVRRTRSILLPAISMPPSTTSMGQLRGPRVPRCWPAPLMHTAGRQIGSH